MEHGKQDVPMRRDRCGEIMRLIDATLAEQDIAAAELQVRIEQNGIEGSEEQLVFDAFRLGHAS